ncbi:MAG: hypothetical protein P4M08_09345 [Oligoflexia bacterium]|nr:hypothetical protein [Oligoflexia bacterium]
MSLSIFFGHAERYAIIFFIFIGAFGCTSPSVEYQLDQFDDLVVSNSEQLTKKPQNLSNGDVELTYRLLVSNRSNSRTYTLDTQQALFSIGKQGPLKANCTPSEKVTLAAGAVTKITCSTIVHSFTEDDRRDRTCKFVLDYQREGDSSVSHVSQDCRLKVRVFL